MKKSIVSIWEQPNKPLEVHILQGEDWEGFDEIVEYFIKSLNIIVFESIDGPDARRWILKKDKALFELIHSDGFGNYLRAPVKESEITIKNIANNIDNHYKSSPNFLSSNN